MSLMNHKKHHTMMNLTILFILSIASLNCAQRNEPKMGLYESDKSQFIQAIQVSRGNDKARLFYAFSDAGYDTNAYISATLEKIDDEYYLVNIQVDHTHPKETRLKLTFSGSSLKIACDELYQNLMGRNPGCSPDTILFTLVKPEK